MYKGSPNIRQWEAQSHVLCQYRILEKDVKQLSGHAMMSCAMLLAMNPSSKAA